MSNTIEFRSPAGALLRQVASTDQAEPWFIAKDVCEALGVLNVSDALTRLDADEKGVAITDTPGGPQEMAIISESGLYLLVLRSRKPEAKTFKRWVTHEVLPEIRRTGSYKAQPATPNLEAMIVALAQSVQTLAVQMAALAVQQTKSALTVSDFDAGELARRLSHSSHQAWRLGLFKSERSARTSFESRIRRACGWARNRGARMCEMPITVYPYAKVEMCEIEADVNRAQNGRQLSLIKAN